MKPGEKPHCRHCYQQWPKSLLFQPFILIVSQVFKNRKCLRTKTKTDCFQTLGSRAIIRFAPISYKKSCIACVVEEEMANVGVHFLLYEKQYNQGGGTYLFTRSNSVHITVRVYPLNPILSAGRYRYIDIYIYINTHTHLTIWEVLLTDKLCKWYDIL